MPIFVFFYLLTTWWYKSKDLEIKKPIIVQYEPPDNLRPAEVDTIMNQKAKPKDITATIIYLAVKDYLKIKEIEISKNKHDYELELLKKDFVASQDLKEYEKEILKKIFYINDPNNNFLRKKISISELDKNFYRYIPHILLKIQESVFKLDYLDKNSHKLSLNLFSIGILLLISSTFFFKNLVFIISFLISSVLFIIFSFFIPRRTPKGAEAYWKILGFKEYINKAEKYRSEFYEKENIFEKYLPYSIIFNLVNKWASVFESVYKSPPSWYKAKIDQRADFPTFVYSLNRSIDRLNSVFVTKGKGGTNRIVRKDGFSSGFSGGGYGGGGGKSW